MNPRLLSLWVGLSLLSPPAMAGDAKLEQMEARLEAVETQA